MKEQFFYETFVSMMTISPKRALEYRNRCLGVSEVIEDTPIEQKIEVSSKSDPTSDGIVVNPDDFTDDEEEVSFTKEELQEKLKTAGVKFSHLAGEESLLKKCLDANLI